MFMTESLGKIVKEQEDTEENKRKAKEKEIDWLIKRIKNWNDQSLRCSIGGYLSLLLCLLFIHVGLLEIERNNYVNSLVMFSFVVPFLYASIKMYSIGNKNKYIDFLKKLFLEVASKPFEVRIEKVKGESKKLKVVIEKNLLIENSHVIKEKSEHLTAYIDSSQSAESVISMICVLVKKAEEKFS